MQEKYLYEYAVIRLVPRVEREEFINVGLILFSKEANYIQIRTFLNTNKLQCYSTECDLETFANQLSSFKKIALGRTEGGYIASLDIAERFRWLTAVRSSSIQTSRPHSGFAVDLDQTFDKLFTELVL